jgi:acyl carrier protein
MDRGGGIVDLHTSGSGLSESRERRQHARIITTLPAGFTVFGGNHDAGQSSPRKYEAHTYDIGMGGASCTAVIDNKEVAKKLSANHAELKLDIELIDKKTQICTKANVAWIYNLKGLSVKTKYRLGFGFVNISKSENDFLITYLKDMIALTREQRVRTREKIKKVLAQITQIDVDSFSEATRIRQDLKVDSLMSMETLAVLETIYEIEIDVGRAAEVVTVGNMVDLIEGYVEYQGQ